MRFQRGIYVQMKENCDTEMAVTRLTARLPSNDPDAMLFVYWDHYSSKDCETGKSNTI